MSLQTVKEQKGFTIVELLIVIVVIGILAAITIVAFNGVQNQAKTTKAQAVASDVQKKAEAYNAMNGRYPLLAEFGSSDIVTLASGNTVNTTTTNALGQTRAAYVVCPTGADADTITGARIRFWDYTAAGAGTMTPANGTGKTLTVGSC